MDDLTKKLTEEMERDLGVKLPAGQLQGGHEARFQSDYLKAKSSTNGGPQQARQPRISEQLDLLIADLNMRIDVLKRLKESL